MEWSIQQIARLAGTTSRTLRHYDQIGLLRPTRVGANGYRYYGDAALVRLQRILLLRELGLGIPAIAAALQGDDVDALRTHRGWLEQERERLDRRIAAVEHTIRARERGEPLMAEDMFDGFDHTQHREEVERRWGARAAADSAAWWESKSPQEKKDWQARQAALAADWTAAAAAGIDPASAEAQALAARHADWLAGIPGTPGYPDGPSPKYLTGLGEMYVADERFAANYGGDAGARFVRDALAAYAAGVRGEV
ncbi:MerR family transcriptional regulator [Schumannella sp. 10F1B-5-1]|uniref:MerR family transcriptional regulator n=1 Tax=Schumannella sp. 10F1B-5-1 TaxID=2590780 RepID=UPI001132995D|nr:MerR family transcriptional regulator [Schumannella sp. 10F1B-5-1]TPW76933.1 MerR family transcriptional regulator [Schumannella sp. 10F1B-5-1]